MAPKLFIKHTFTPDRVLGIALAVLISTVVALMVVLYVVPAPQAGSLGAYETPQKILNVDQDPSTPIVTVGQETRLIIFGERCVNRKSVQVLSYRTFTEIDPETGMGIKTVAGSVRLTEERSGGKDCLPTERNILIPEGVDSGIWRIDNIDQSTEDGTVRIWSSENFEVR